MSNAIKFDYTNYKRVKSKRKIIPIKLIFDFNQYQGDNKNMWLLIAFDIDNQDIRSFDVRDIHFPVYVHKCWIATPTSVDGECYCSLYHLLRVILQSPEILNETIKIFKYKFSS